MWCTRGSRTYNHEMSNALTQLEARNAAVGETRKPALRYLTTQVVAALFYSLGRRLPIP